MLPPGSGRPGGSAPFIALTGEEDPARFTLDAGDAHQGCRALLSPGADSRDWYMVPFIRRTRAPAVPSLPAAAPSTRQVRKNSNLRPHAQRRALYPLSYWPVPRRSTLNSARSPPLINQILAHVYHYTIIRYYYYCGFITSGSIRSFTIRRAAKMVGSTT